MEPPRIFESAAIKAAVALAEKVGPVDIPVLIAGETGSGKEIIADLIHASSERCKKEMLCINCAGLPAELVESELFGSRRGAFTGSVDEKIGLVRQADNSTLFLDELSEMPIHLQSKLLRFIQDKRIRKIGSVVNETVNTRIIAAVNREPRRCIADKCLREDLYYRLSAITINVPPLRERQADIMPLAKAYLHYFCEQFKRKPPLFTKEIAEALCSYSWPGNVRQLLNEMTRCALLAGKEIKISNLSLERVTPANDSLQVWIDKNVTALSKLDHAEAKAVVDALLACDFNKERAADRLGVSRGTVYAKIKQFGIKIPAMRGQAATRTPRRNGHAVPLSAPPILKAPAHPVPRSVEQSVESPVSPSVGLQEGEFLD